TPHISPLSLHDALPISRLQIVLGKGNRFPDVDPLSERAALHIEQGQRKLESLRHDSNDGEAAPVERELLSDELGIGIESTVPKRSEEHTSELQSPYDLV